ncbi:MAG: serine/threonine protein kinase, partial [Halochromatium sp.]
MTILQKDDRIGGYHIERLIGRGGMGEIYLARQTSIDRHVALKVLNPQLVQRDPKFAEQFTREAQAAGHITHPGIIAVHDVGQDTVRGGTVHYFSMEYVDGEDFRAILEREGPLDRELASEVMSEVARALAYAGRMGMVHRDVKPENIMRTRDGRIKLADFGLAMHITEPEDDDRDDQGRRKVLGTPRYMSPEQARGHSVDHRSDQY